jgi:CelD/BcsL family acetyltransferase involved in cellulose biosynthesis
VVRTELGDRAAGWDRIVDSMTVPSPFLRSWWLDAVRGDRSAFLLVVADDELMGGLATNVMVRRGITRTELLPSGALWPHGLDVVARPGDEATVVRTVLDHVDRSGRLGVVVDFGGTSPTSALATYAPSRARVELVDEWMTIDRPVSYESYLAARPRHLRQEIRRVERRLTERGVEYRTTRGLEGLEESLAEFERLHRLRWQDGGSGFLPALSVFARAARAGAERGEVVVHELACGPRVLASLVTLEVAASCCLYQIGRDPDPEWSGTGMFLRSAVIRRSCELGHTRIDLGTGSPELKVQWIDERRPLARLRWGHRLGRAVFGWRSVKQPLMRGSQRRR